MSDASYIELPPSAPRRRSFFRSWRGAALGLFLMAAILAGCFSWWLSQGKISSAYGRVDTMVYTVEPEQIGRLEQILVQQGQDVMAGQPLARLEGQQQPIQAQEAPNARTDPTQENERRMAAKLAQARQEEEKYQRIHQNRVTEHVRSQLYLRSLNPQDPVVYEQAVRLEESARAVAELAREDFEKVSKARATIESELGRLRIELSRKKLRQPRSEKPEQPKPPQVAISPIDILYAPVNGRIVGITARPGQTIQRGMPVFMIMPPDNGGSWIQAWFPLSARKMLKLGQKASIKSGDLHLIGHVAAIAAEPQPLPPEVAAANSAQYLPVSIQAEDPAQLAKLAPGTNVECQIQTRYVLDAGII